VELGIDMEHIPLLPYVGSTRLLAKLMEIVDKTDEFEQIRNLYFDRK